MRKMIWENRGRLSNKELRMDREEVKWMRQIYRRYKNYLFSGLVKKIALVKVLLQLANDLFEDSHPPKS